MERRGKKLFIFRSYEEMRRLVQKIYQIRPFRKMFKLPNVFLAHGLQ
jgi:hypothetical protein